ncbi:MAG: SRPBCC domain-containing protein [Oceanicaulis sp.]|uniref:SRPBCC family protein n=1 Tax=Glycocaulis sp. TaxID=1969725 RepID=UPI0025BE3354|nr:SRPBCC domain-containing protein [Glycocaulis sp.]MCC5982239.1 SRPBCC domain-containing protein [Oceanicaulis sp.]MCH8520956.1 SRPBCC domain-containing protein [Glycocaulis sp.]
MTPPETETRSVIVERNLPHPPEKVWRALTTNHLIAEWLMETDFRAEPGHRFGFTQDWGTIECEVLAVEPQRSLAYSWGGHELETVVTWTLTPVPGGTHLRMEQTGFRKDQARNFGGAQAGWPRFLDTLEQLLGKLNQSGRTT